MWSAGREEREGLSDDPFELFRTVNAELTGPGGAFALQNRDDPHRRQFAGTLRNFCAVMDRARANYADRVYLTYRDENRTYGEVIDQADRLAAVLGHRRGIEKGDRVGIAMRNRMEWFVVFLALQRLGAIATLLNSRGVAAELAGTAAQVGCKLIFADDERGELLAKAASCPVLGLADLEALVADKDAPPHPGFPDLDPDDPSHIIFTSGTTGRPKAATLTHRNLCAVVREMELRGEAGLTMAAMQAGQPVEVLRAAMPPPQPVLLISPLYHISGIVGMASSLTTGSRLILMRRWDPVEALDIIEANGCGMLSGPSMIFADLLALPDAGHRMRSMRSCAIAGQATPVKLGAELREQVAGMMVASCWGQTECTGAATTATGAMFAARPDTVGVAIDTIDLKVVDEHGDELPCGQVGELLMRGSTVMQGYWGDDAANAAAFRDGWLCTGDLGWIDEDGLIFIADRVKDMVISAGVNIYCAEVERVLSMMEHQHEVALFGVPDERLGERTIAAVVPRQGAEALIDEAAVKAHVRAHLADYKVPAEVRFDLGPLPRNDIGKVDKARLAQRYFELAPANVS
jgi:long-chain acyl-CoA synthetase